MDIVPHHPEFPGVCDQLENREISPSVFADYGVTFPLLYLKCNISPGPAGLHSIFLPDCMMPVSFSFSSFTASVGFSPCLSHSACSRPQDKLRPDGRRVGLIHPSDAHLHRIYTSVRCMAKRPGSTYCQGLPAVFMPFLFFLKTENRNGIFLYQKDPEKSSLRIRSIIFFKCLPPCTLYHGQTFISPSKHQSSRLSYTADVGYFLSNYCNLWADPPVTWENTCNSLTGISVDLSKIVLSWIQPIILLFLNDPEFLLSYPDLIMNARYFSILSYIPFFQYPAL